MKEQVCNNLSRKLLLFLLSAIPSIVCLAQKGEIKFGKITKEALEADVGGVSYGSAAVVLYDKGHFDKNSVMFTRSVRIKILTSSGTSFGNFVIRAPNKSFIQGFTFNLENGEVVKTKLESSNIYEEKVINGIERYKLFFPAVKPGSVIDINYSHYGLPFEWHFQNIIPTIKSELILEPTDFIVFKKIPYGFEPIRETRVNHWVAENVPALKVEPFMNHYENYLTKFQFEIQQMKGFRATFYYELSTSWQKVSDRLLEFDLFGGVLRSAGFLNDKAKSIRQSGQPTLGKIHDALTYIKENIKWNNVNSLIASEGYGNHFKTTHSGNSADINLLLIALLNKADIKTYPVVLSTRDNGILNPISASLSKLNYVVAYVKHGDITLLLDATSPHAVPGILPENCLNHEGWLVTSPSGEWVDLNETKTHRLKQFIRIFPGENNELKADITNSYEDYAYLEWIEKYEKDDKEIYVKKLSSDRLDKHSIESINKMELKAAEHVVLDLWETDHVQDIGRELIINPFVLHELENPFKTEDRKYPIDFVYPRTRSIIISVTLPKEYKLKSVPQSLSISTENGGARFQFLCNAVNGNIVNIRCDLHIVKQVFTEDEYAGLKNFFSEVIKKMNEPIQVDKNT